MCEEVPPCEGGEALAGAAQRGWGCPVAGSAQGQAGRGSEQPGPEEGVPAQGRAVGPDSL